MGIEMAYKRMSQRFYEEADKVTRLQTALADAVYEAEWLIGQVPAWDGADRPNLQRKIDRWKALSGAVLPSEWSRVVREHGAPMRRQAP